MKGHFFALVFLVPLAAHGLPPICTDLMDEIHSGQFAKIAKSLQEKIAGGALGETTTLVNNADWSRSLSTPRLGAIFLRSNTTLFKPLLGTLQAYELFPGYTVIRLESADGKVHLVDPLTLPHGTEVVLAHPGVKQIPPALEESLGNKKGDHVFFVNNEKAKTAFCADQKKQEKDPRYKELKQVVEKYAARVERTQLFYRFAAACPTVGTGLLLGGFDTWDRIQTNRDAKAKQNDPLNAWDLHGTNFVGSLGLYMGGAVCLRTASPTSQKTILALMFGAGVVGNLMAEIKLVDGQRDMGGGLVKTDTKDFVAGVSGVAVGALISAVLEPVVKIGLGKLCR